MPGLFSNSMKAMHKDLEQMNKELRENMPELIENLKKLVATDKLRTDCLYADTCRDSGRKDCDGCPPENFAKKGEFRE